jgi:hypothetical protein
MSALQRYARKNDERMSAGETAAISGLGMTAASTAHGGISAYLQDEALKDLKYTRDYEKFRKSLEPGDILYYKRPGGKSANAELGGIDLPLKETNVMQAGKGDQYYHPAIYEGKGMIRHSAGWDEGIKRSPLLSGLDEEILAQRPKKKQLVKKALNRSEKMLGGDYKQEMETMTHGAKHHLGVKTPTGGKCGTDPLLCSEYVAESYPDLFGHREISPRAMRASKDAELVGRYATSNLAKGMTATEKAMIYGAYPALKSLKYGALAAAAGYAGSKLQDKFNPKKEQY